MPVIGLISDTHMPQRWKRLPDTVFRTFADVDLIIHAGDVGELWVLDELSALAPVVAVHGNDETDEATAALPFLQTVVLDGQRIVVTHGHYPDRVEEMAKRKDDTWHPKLSRWADFGRQHGAQIVIYGHTHIPMSVLHDGVWLVNPGAIASGGAQVRQKIQSIARMTLAQGQPPQVEHVILNQPELKSVPAVDLDAGFVAAWHQFSELILTPELAAEWDWLVREVYPIVWEDLLRVFLPIAHDCWEDGHRLISPGMVVDVVKADAVLSDRILDKLAESAVFAPYLG